MTYRGTGQTERAAVSDNRRIASACPLPGGGCPTTTVSLGTATFEYTVFGLSGETDGTTSTYYVHDPAGGLLAQLAPTGSPSYYLLDGRDSIIGITDPARSVTARYHYDAYGQLTGITGAAATTNPWRFASAYQDGTGLYKMGARYYDPTTGRFTQQDPIFNPLDPHQWNRYTYAGNDPINYSDPSGLCSATWTGWWDCPYVGAKKLWDKYGAKAKCMLSQLNPFNFLSELGAGTSAPGPLLDAAGFAATLSKILAHEGKKAADRYIKTALASLSRFFAATALIDLGWAIYEAVESC